MKRLIIIAFILLTILFGCSNPLLSELDGFYDMSISAKDIRPPEINELSHAIGDLTFIKNHGSKLIQWNTDIHPAVDQQGRLLQPSYPAASVEDMILATVRFRNGSMRSFVFEVIVDPVPIDDQRAVDEAAEALMIYYAGGDDSDNVTSDVGLRTAGLHGTSISWTTTDDSVAGTDGSILRPSYLNGNTGVTLTAVIMKGTASASKTFSLTVLFRPATDLEKANSDAAALEIGFSDGDSANSVRNNVNFPANGENFGSNISWDTSSHSAVDQDGIISTTTGNWWSASANTVSGTVRASITNGSTTVTKTFSLSVIVTVPVPIPQSWSTSSSFGRRFIRFAKISGADYLMNYQVQYRRFTDGSWNSWTSVPGGYFSSANDPVFFGWTTSQLSRGRMQFRARVNRDGRTGNWGYSPEYSNF